jgi:hypothetical protein
MEFTDWAKAMMIANSFTSTMGPADEESWQDWAANFVNLPRIETLSLPHPYLYSNWRDWAEGVAIAMTQSGF